MTMPNTKRSPSKMEMKSCRMKLSDRFSTLNPSQETINDQKLEEITQQHLKVFKTLQAVRAEHSNSALKSKNESASTCLESISSEKENNKVVAHDEELPDQEVALSGLKITILNSREVSTHDDNNSECDNRYLRYSKSDSLEPSKRQYSSRKRSFTDASQSHKRNNNIQLKNHPPKRTWSYKKDEKRRSQESLYDQAYHGRRYTHGQGRRRGGSFVHNAMSYDECGDLEKERTPSPKSIRISGSNQPVPTHIPYECEPAQYALCTSLTEITNQHDQCHVGAKADLQHLQSGNSKDNSEESRLNDPHGESTQKQTASIIGIYSRSMSLEDISDVECSDQTQITYSNNNFTVDQDNLNVQDMDIDNESSKYSLKESCPEISPGSIEPGAHVSPVIQCDLQYVNYEKEDPLAAEYVCRFADANLQNGLNLSDPVQQYPDGIMSGIGMHGLCDLDANTCTAPPIELEGVQVDLPIVAQETIPHLASPTILQQNILKEEIIPSDADDIMTESPQGKPIEYVPAMSVDNTSTTKGHNHPRQQLMFHGRPLIAKKFRKPTEILLENIPGTSKPVDPRAALSAMFGRKFEIELNTVKWMQLRKSKSTKKPVVGQPQEKKQSKVDNNTNALSGTRSSSSKLLAKPFSTSDTLKTTTVSTPDTGSRKTSASASSTKSTIPVGTLSTWTSPSKTPSIQTSPVDSLSIHASPSDSMSIHASPVDSLVIHASPIDSLSIQASPVDSLSIQASPVNSSSLLTMYSSNIQPVPVTTYFSSTRATAVNQPSSSGTQAFHVGTANTWVTPIDTSEQQHLKQDLLVKSPDQTSQLLKKLAHVGALNIIATKPLTSRMDTQHDPQKLTEQKIEEGLAYLRSHTNKTDNINNKVILQEPKLISASGEDSNRSRRHSTGHKCSHGGPPTRSRSPHRSRTLRPKNEYTYTRQDYQRLPDRSQDLRRVIRKSLKTEQTYCEGDVPVQMEQSLFGIPSSTQQNSEFMPRHI